MARSKVSFKVGTKQDLAKRLEQPSGTALVRGINERELSQLLADGPEKFRINQFTTFEVNNSVDAIHYAKNRSGTIVVYALPEADEDIRSYFDLGGAWATCMKGGFTAPVEVYNLWDLSSGMIKKFYS